ncbi:hypothetical protein BET10_02500 [Pseudoalteromonas amylolytica]|uniref:HTH luxR-type domain-containing protein n=2 Tax=Pseudoalteromonas TaxID=53246 RepID=A0A1S1MWN4_9GAMM|nr:hypothetical protein BFC16_02590 [Pseudoalteromonas sp. JW3]OHU93192.1 hypothetical protein BET10_02500 [Pseudoalteromonas amylolytica]
MKELKMTNENVSLVNFNKINVLMADFEKAGDTQDLTSILKKEALECGYKVLGVLDYNPLSAQSYQLNYFGEIDKDLAKCLDSDDGYLHCKNGLRIKPLSQVIDYKDNCCGLYLLPLRGVAGIAGGIIFDIPETVETFGSIEMIDWYWTILSPYLLNAAIRCRTGSVNITKREKDCLVWACEGKTSWEISQILGISERTVNFHLSNCIVKTNSANRQQAIVKCLVKNLI